MKLSFLFLLLNLMQLSASVYSQNTQFKLKESNMSLKQIFKEIESQTNYRFAYRESFVDDNETMNALSKNMTVEEFLEDVVKEMGYGYLVLEDNLVVITAKDDKLLIQEIIIKGIVTDVNNIPLPGVNIVEKGTTNGTVTNLDGEYSISVSTPDAILSFSYVGYLSEELEINGQTTIDIKLVEDILALEEVVVVGYGSMKKNDLTGAVTTANIDKFRESPNTNILQSLSGAVPGLDVAQVTSSGENPSLMVRGKNSISGSNAPLIVVDGVIFSGTISSINTADVERVDILKDASSAAVYGAAAANGVIIITTKQAKSNGGKPIFNYSTSFSLSEPTSMPTPLNAQQYYDKAKNVLWDRGYLAPDYTQPNPDFDPTKEWIRNPVKEGWENGNDFDWLDAVTQTGHIQDHLLSVSNRNENSNYYISAGYTDQLGYIMNDKYKRWTGRINIENNLTPWMNLGIRSFVANEDFSGAEPNIMRAFHFPPPVTPYDDEGKLVTYPDGQIFENPFYTSEIDDLDKRLEVNGIVSLSIDVPFVEGLTYKATMGNRYNARKRFYFNQWANAQNGAAQKYNASEHNRTFDNIINYKKSFNEAHNIDVTLVAGQEERVFENTDARAAFYTNKVLGYNSLESGSASNSSLASSAWNESSLYAMGRINYNYKSKYLTTFTIRRDGYSGFAANKKWGTFSSAAFAWVLSEEDFFKNTIPFIQYLKLRGSYGENGNRTSRYSSLAIVSSSYQYVFGNGSGSYAGQSISKLPNNDLGWEKTVGLNIGLDFNFNWLSGNIDYYNTNTTDLFWNISLPTITGFSNIASNVGKLNNTGLEFTLTSTNVRTSDFTWQTTLNFTLNRNKMVNTIDIDGDGNTKDDLISQNLFIGESIDAIYDYTIEGIYQLNDDIPSGYYPGTYRLKDLNNDGSVTPLNDRSIIGYKDPSYQFSVMNTFSYKKFSLLIYVNSIQGGKNRYMDINDPSSYIEGRDNIINDNTFEEWDFWYPANPDATYARVDGVAGAISPYIMKQRSFVRLQDVNLSYRFDGKMLNKIGLNSAKLFVSGKNLLTITKWEGLDPEADRESPNQVGLGLTNRGRPVMKSFTIGLDISF